MSLGLPTQDDDRETGETQLFRYSAETDNSVFVVRAIVHLSTRDDVDSKGPTICQRCQIVSLKKHCSKMAVVVVV